MSVDNNKKFLMSVPGQAMRNKAALESVTECGCYQCLGTFPPSRVVEWTDGGQTALCPVCRRDCVIPSADRDTLASSRRYWFGG